MYSKSANSIVAYIPVLKSIILSAKLESMSGSTPGLYSKNLTPSKSMKLKRRLSLSQNEKSRLTGRR